MHDPMTLAFSIPNPLSRAFWMEAWSMAPSFLEVWHVDPEKNGDSDSCDWFGTHALSPADLDWLRACGRAEHAAYFRGVLRFDTEPDGRLVKNPRGERWAGGMIHASNLDVLYGIASTLFWRMPVRGVPLFRRRFAGWRLRRALAAAFPVLLAQLSHPDDNLHDLVGRARACTDEGEFAMGELFVAVARALGPGARPMHRHPRGHLHHWEVRVIPWQNLRNWITRTCVSCGARFPWGYAPIRDDRGYRHHACPRETP